MIMEIPVLTTKSINITYANPALKIFERIYLLHNLDLFMEQIKKKIIASQQEGLSNRSNAQYLLESYDALRRLKGYTEASSSATVDDDEPSKDRVRAGGIDFIKGISKDLAGATVIGTEFNLAGKTIPVVLGVRATITKLESKKINDFLQEYLYNPNKATKAVYSLVSSLFSSSKWLLKQIRDIQGYVTNVDRNILIDYIFLDKKDRSFLIYMNKMDLDNPEEMMDKLDSVHDAWAKHMYKNIRLAGVIIDDYENKEFHYNLFSETGVIRRSLTYPQIAHMAEIEIDDLEKLERTTSIFSA